jgi:hypothetical protein
MASALSPMIMIHTCNRQIADIAECFLAVLAIKHVSSIFLLVDRLAVWTSCTEFDVDIIIIFSNRLIKFHLLCDLFWLECSIETEARGVLFEMLLTFCKGEADPTKPSVALWTLNMRTLRVLHQSEI